MTELLVIATFLLVLATGGLIYVTWGYAKHTQEMANVMQKDYELRINHHFNIICEIEDNTPDMLGGRVKIENIGLNTVYVKNPQIIFITSEPSVVENSYEIEDVGLEVLDPRRQTNSFHYFRIQRADIASERYLDTGNFFGGDCKVLFRIEIAGPDQVFTRQSKGII